jgi:hypothetical protein
MLELDKRGVPGAMIATTAFEQGYRAQAKILAFEPAVIYTPHPIQNRTDTEIQQFADDIVGSVLQSITTG